MVYGGVAGGGVLGQDEGGSHPPPAHGEHLPRQGAAGGGAGQVITGWRPRRGRRAGTRWLTVVLRFVFPSIVVLRMNAVLPTWMRDVLMHVNTGLALMLLIIMVIIMMAVMTIVMLRISRRLLMLISLMSVVIAFVSAVLFTNDR